MNIAPNMVLEEANNDLTLQDTKVQFNSILKDGMGSLESH